MVITKDDVSRVRFMLEAPRDDDPPGTLRLTATLFDGRLFLGQRLLPSPDNGDFVEWAANNGHVFSSPAAAQAFRNLIDVLWDEVALPEVGSKWPSGGRQAASCAA